MDADEIAAGALELAALELLRQRLVRTVAVPNPGAGLEWSAAVPSGAYWELLSIVATLSTSAVVANRAPRFQVTDEQSNVIDSISGGTITTAGGAARYSLMAGLGATITTGVGSSSLPSPPLLLLPGWSIVSSTVAIDAGDLWSGVRLQVREWTPHAVVQAAEWLAGHLR